MPDISFLVTAHSKPAALKITLSSLILQKSIKAEVIVSNNAKGKMADEISNVCAVYGISCIINSSHDCYSACEHIAKYATGKYICFPSEEDYYTPVFGKKLLDHARRYKLELVYCDSLYDSRYIGSYEVMRVQPIIGHIDKGGFLLRRNLFNGFPGVPDDDVPALCDGLLIEKLRTEGISFGKIPEVLWVHN